MTRICLADCVKPDLIHVGLFVCISCLLSVSINIPYTSLNNVPKHEKHSGNVILGFTS